MREIKFRGFGIYEWCYGSLIRSGGISYIVEEISVSNDYGDGTDLYATVWSEVSPESIGQYTGLKDKNSKDIYEGDILNWDEKEWGAPFKEIVKWDYEQLSERIHDWPKHCVIIGNICENPQLLEQPNES